MQTSTARQQAPQMSHSRRFGGIRFMSAYPPIATGQRTTPHFAFGPETDIAPAFKSVGVVNFND